MLDIVVAVDWRSFLSDSAPFTLPLLLVVLVLLAGFFPCLARRFFDLALRESEDSPLADSDSCPGESIGAPSSHNTMSRPTSIVWITPDE